MSVFTVEPAVEQSVSIAGSWAAWDPLYPDYRQWHRCIHQALTEAGKDVFTDSVRRRAEQLYKRPLWEVFRGRDGKWRVQGARAIVGFHSKAAATKFAQGNRTEDELERSRR